MWGVTTTFGKWYTSSVWFGGFSPLCIRTDAADPVAKCPGFTPTSATAKLAPQETLSSFTVGSPDGLNGEDIKMDGENGLRSVQLLERQISARDDVQDLSEQTRIIPNDRGPWAERVA